MKDERANSENMLKLRKQIEYYFGDFNLPQDRFMNKVIQENVDGWFPVETLLKFKKIKALEAGLCEIVESLVDSDVVKVNEGQTHIKRKHPLKDAAWVNDRTIQAKGFPKDNFTLNEFVDFWSKICPAVKNVELCGKFSGVLNISFEDKDLADEWAANKHEVIYKGQKILLGRNLYKPPSMKRMGRERGRGRGRGRGSRGRGGRGWMRGRGRGRDRGRDRGRGGKRGGYGQLDNLGDESGYHSTMGKRQRLTDHVANKDLIGVEVGVEKPSDIVGEVRDDWEKKAEAERADLGL